MKPDLKGLEDSGSQKAHAGAFHQATHNDGIV
jgi:hypothetical protein